MKVERKSPLTGEFNTLDLPVTIEQLMELERPGPQRRLLQDIFPDLTPPEREFLKTGYTPEDWDTMFPKCPVCGVHACDCDYPKMLGEIIALLDGKEWDADTTSAIATVLTEAGATISEPGGGCDGCTNPTGHKWNRTAGEADEARIAHDYENDNIRCVYCGADGDA